MNFYKILSTNIIYLLSDLFVFLALRHRKYDAFMKNIFEPKYNVEINLRKIQNNRTLFLILIIQTQITFTMCGVAVDVSWQSWALDCWQDSTQN